MKKIVFLSIIVSFLCSYALQGQTYKVLFKVEAEPEMGMKYIGYGENIGLEEISDCNLYVNSKDYPDLEDFMIGKVSLINIKDSYSLVEVNFIEGFQYLEGMPLLAEVPTPIPNNAYSGICYKIAALGITLLDSYEKEAMDFSNFTDDGIIYDNYFIEYLLKDMKELVPSLRDVMDEPQLTEGKYAGKGMFDAMEAATKIDVEDFFDFILTFPASYMGKNWKFAEIFATWLVNGSPKGEGNYLINYESKEDIGFELMDDSDVDFPRVKWIDQAVWGAKGYNIDAGTVVLKYNNESLYQKSAKTTEQKIKTQANSGSTLTVLQNGIVSEVTIHNIACPMESLKKEFNEDRFSKFVRLYPVRRNGKVGFIDASGKEMIPIVYDDFAEEMNGVFSEGLMAVKKEDKWGFVNLLGEIVILPKFYNVESFNNGFCAFEDGTDEDIFGGKKGFINKRGEEVIPVKYETPYLGTFFSEDLCMIRDEELLGFIDKRGKIVIEPKFYFATEFCDGLAAACLEEGGKYGYISKDGSWVIEPQYDLAYEFIDGIAIVSKNNDYELIDTKGNVLVNFKGAPYIGFVRPTFYENRILFEKDGKKGVMNSDGIPITEAKFLDCSHCYSEGMLGVSETCTKDGLFCYGDWYFINNYGEKTIEGPFEEVSMFSEGVCWVRLKGRWGLINKKGKWILNPQFENMPLQFEHGISQCSRDVDVGKFLPEKEYYYINKEGKIIWQP